MMCGTELHSCRPVSSDGGRAKLAHLMVGAASGASVGVVSVPLGIWVFRRGELHAKKHGKLKRSG